MPIAELIGSGIVILQTMARNFGLIPKGVVKTDL
jgi:hypothetical protein